MEHSPSLSTKRRKDEEQIMTKHMSHLKTQTYKKIITATEVQSLVGSVGNI